ncbi:MAG: multidrug efflux RND transporter permease subunit [Candidatus Accumulibacter sp.]|jgi:HAE1 family hydrophobic/amphiphilic exporter-1/multidrug efflux pump|nr:multidrug efflux RND transporter permease subunit [Accumulibacter sp.]
MSRFFINRPIFASVISIVMVVAGIVAALTLPVSQYPEIAPPTVVISATYPGASAETLTRTVAAPIEEQLSGIDGLMYFNSSSSSNGSLTITVSFEVGTDPDIATVYVNNRVKIAEPRLPDVVRQYGVTVMKRSPNILFVADLTSPNKTHSRLYLSNYALINIIDDVRRVPGVGDAQIFGAQDYSMRVWLMPDRMAQLGVTTTDIVNAVASQNRQNAAGKIGQEPAPDGQQLVYTIVAKGRLLTPEEFGNIVVRADGGRGVLYLKDVARLELGAQNYDSKSNKGGQEQIGIGVFLQAGANALDTARLVKERLDELKQSFPDDLEYSVPYDTTKFIQASIEEVLHTLVEAIFLVAIVVFVFLQNWRATLIPLIAVPVSLIGTFAGLWICGFSINTLTLFAMVLAIGIVVDDAIVVLENVERLMTSEKLGAKAASIAAMREVAAALVAIVLVLCAVFVPVAFLGGIAGELYKQFAVTVSISVTLSGVIALTLTPALCAILLRHEHKDVPFFRPFNRAFYAITNYYAYIVEKTLRHRVAGTLICAAVFIGSFFMFRAVPGGFVPLEDQGFLLSALILPDGASLQRTDVSANKFQQMVRSDPGSAEIFAIAGNDIVSGSMRTNAGTVFIPLKDWGERKDDAETLRAKFSRMGMTLTDGMALVFNPPPIQGLGTSGGFEAYIQARGDSDPIKLSTVTQQLLGELRKQPELSSVSTFYRPSSPQIYVEVDESKAMSFGIQPADVYTTLQGTMGALYVNDFNISGHTYRVQLQAESLYRLKPDDLGKVYVRAADGAMIPVSALVKVKEVFGAEQLERFNGFLAAKIMGDAQPGVSLGDSIKTVETVARETLPDGYELAWVAQAFQAKRSGTASALAFGFGILMVFLILAAQYERWSLPIAVILAVPFGLFGAFGFVMLRGMPNDIYFQIGLIVLIGLAAKNAILIVEFAAQKHSEGMSLMEAAITSARLRFRPIIMTSLAFILGVFPLVRASGAGAAGRQSMGTGVFGGMVTATFIATLFIPMFFTLLSSKEPQKLDDDANEEGANETH